MEKIYTREIYIVRLTSIEVTAWWKIYLDDELSNSKFRYLHFLKNIIVYDVVIAEFWIGQIVVEIGCPPRQRA